MLSYENWQNKEHSFYNESEVTNPTFLPAFQGETSRGNGLRGFHEVVDDQYWRVILIQMKQGIKFEKNNRTWNCKKFQKFVGLSSK